jgi:signal recognition particle subunit SRP54
MFKSLSDKISNIFDNLRSRGSLTEVDINNVIRDIRIALLEADVSLPVVKSFIDIIKEKAVGQKIIESVKPAQMIIKIIHDELVGLLSAPDEKQALNLKASPPVNILMIGLQGSGKTTSSAKLALHLKEKHNKKVLLVSLDIYRPAAQEQLEIYAKSAQIDSLEIVKEEAVIDITKRAIANQAAYDVVIYDTAGRIHIDDDMMNELENVKKLINPQETLLVVDALTGQDAVNIATSFDERLGITGTILSRIDADARGGAALSIRYITNKPIKFLSTGEKLADFEIFHPDRIASRILDMGDVVSLVEKASEIVDQKEADKAARRLKKGLFNLNDYLSQLRNIKKIGGLGSMIAMIPGAKKMMPKIDMSEKENAFKRQEAIILSMTKKERRTPSLINGSRRKRIADGSGTSINEINKLLKQFMQISKFMKKAGSMDQKTLMRSDIGKLLS